jgi:hypothetical protein
MNTLERTLSRKEPVKEEESGGDKNSAKNNYAPWNE